MRTIRKTTRIAILVGLGACFASAANDEANNDVIYEAADFLDLPVPEVPPPGSSGYEGSELERAALNDLGFTDQRRKTKSFFDCSLAHSQSSPISVAFIGGSPQTHHAIKAVANEWTAEASISFDFGCSSDETKHCRIANPDKPAQIRLSFNHQERPAHWSYIGIEAIDQVAADQPTMNLQGFGNKTADDPSFRHLVLHEFGHALGFRHEHQHPFVDCSWRWDYVCAHFWHASRMYCDDVKLQIQRMDVSSAYFLTAHDTDSVMHYATYPEYFEDGAESACYARQSSQLSPLDRYGVKRAFDSTCDVVLRTFGESISKDLIARYPDELEMSTPTLKKRINAFARGELNEK